jgi:hypothetical protein
MTPHDPFVSHFHNDYHHHLIKFKELVCIIRTTFFANAVYDHTRKISEYICFSFDLEISEWREGGGGSLELVLNTPM